MSNFKCTISYKGTNFYGSQRQTNQRTVQGELEKAIFQVTGEELTITIAGRTDSGVHALGQVINFKSQTKLSPHALTKLLNRALPADVQVLSCEKVNEDFNARFCAKQKTYQYNFYCSQEIVPYLDDVALCVPFKIDIEKMQLACSYLLGEHDFSCFMATGSKVKDTVRTIDEIYIKNNSQNNFTLVISGKSFLYNMVRIIVGVLLRVGDGTLQPQDIKQIIQNKSRPRTKTVSAKGLVLEKIIY